MSYDFTPINFNLLYGVARRVLYNYLEEIDQNKPLPNVQIEQLTAQVIKDIEADAENYNGENIRVKNSLADGVAFIKERQGDMYFYQWSDDKVNIFYESEKNMSVPSLFWPEGITYENRCNIIIALFAHELIHAYLYITCGVFVPKKSVIVHEYLAWAIFCVSLNEENLDKMEKKAIEVGIFEDWFNIEVYTDTSVSFAWQAYRHYIRKGQARIFAEIVEQKEKWKPY